ncbi:MAG: UDP-N-acetylmuramate--L-alanine ligase [Candidatus Buchananbacteria bacterium]
MLLKKLNLAEFKSIYFIGIGGVGMSATAIIAKNKGFLVAGSDAHQIYPPTSEILKQAKIFYAVGYRPANLQKFIKNNQAVLVVVGGGESEQGNVEVKLALRKKIKIASFPQVIGELTKGYSNIVVAGAHGKTTTAAMVGWVMHQLKLQPNIWVGGEMKNFKTNAKLDAGKYFVMEGDEYKAAYWDNAPKFSYYHPQILIFHNLEVDHFDVYKNLAQLIAAVKKLVKQVPSSGLILANGDDDNLRSICRLAKARVIYYGFKKDNHFHPRQIGIKSNCNFFSLFAKNKKLATFTLPQVGLHNIFNALPAIILAKELGYDYLKISLALKKFAGITRRLEIKGRKRGIVVIDDYAHNPAKVKAALAAVRLQFPLKRIWAVFEPHTYTRTYNTLSALAQSFGNADKVLLSEIYPAREKNLKKLSKLIDGQKVLLEITKYHPFVSLAQNRQAGLAYLLANLKRGDVVVVMAVGAFNGLADELLKKL